MGFVGCVPVDWGTEVVLVVDPEPEAGIQDLFCAAGGLPACQWWAWGFAEEEGAFVLNDVAEEAEGRKKDTFNQSH